MLILAGGDKRLLEAHHEAVKETLAVMEQTVSARDTKEGVTRIVTSGKMVAALFTHDTSRNLDPQIHTHAVMANVTELDGKWKALATDTIHGAGFIETAYRNQITYGKIYRNVLKGKAEAMGYETLPTGGRHDLWEIKGFTEDVLEEFSSRHREIHARAGEDNGKAAGLTMVPLRPGSGEVSRGTERRIITTGGQAALLQKSRNGETLVVNTLDEALSTARKHPTSGILLKTGNDSPSQQLLKISGGLEPVAETVVRAAVNSVQNTPPIPEDTVSTAVPADIGDAAVRDLVRRDSHQPDVPVVPEAQIMASDSRADVAGEEKLAKDLSRAVPQEMTDSEKSEIPDARSVTDEVKLAGRVLEDTRQDSPGIIRMPEESREQPVHSGKGDTELAAELSAAARTEREIAAGLSRPVQHDAPERMPPELSHAPSRNIQKER
jgi:hypothetical protein